MLQFSLFSHGNLTVWLLPLTLFLSWTNPAIAQIIPDTTLGAESSRLTPLDALNQRIDGGAIRGSNLFHSFQDFNINDGQSAFFNNPAGIENILTRVTGGNPSNIFGTLGILGNANLFLLNPNGIVFGPNAQLDLTGSFFASTAESLVFADGDQFSATNPDVPPLLTINVPIGLQFGVNSGEILNQSVATNDAGEVRGLQVPSGETLALVGGNVTLDGGNLQPRGGQVELGGLAGTGTVGINADGSLSFPDGVERADVVLRNAAEVNVRAGGGGSIAVRARNLEMSGESKLRAGIESGMGAPGTLGGDIVVEATGITALNEGSFITNSVLENATGNSGDVDVSTGSLQVSSGASLGASTRGEGNGGLLRIQVADTASFNNGDAFSQVTAGAVGNTQGIEITARALSVSNGAQLEASTFGQGDAGKITIRATDTVSFDGVSAEGFQSGAFSNVQEGGVGNTQGIEITTGTLSVTNKGQLGTNVYGTGNSGRISIFADTVTFSRGDALSQVGNLLSPQGQRAVGNSGGIEIVTGSLFLNNAASLGTSTYAQGNAGKITIRATDTVSLNGVSQADSDRSSIVNTVYTSAVGNSEGIDIITGSLFLNNAFVGTTTLGQGDAGKIAIQAENTQVNNTVISGQIGSEAVGNSQGIDIATESLSLSNSNINTEVSGVGEAGDISIQATDVVSLENSTINSVVESLGNFTAIGKGGDITLSARALSLNNSGVFASTDGQGDAGNISVQVTDLVSISGSLGFSTTVFAGGVGQGGNIDIETGDLFLGSGTRLVTATEGQGDAGKITVRAGDVVSLDNGVIGTSVTQNAIGNAGEIEIATDRLSLTNGALINAATNGQGNAGQVEIQATDTITLDGNSYIATSVFQNGVGSSQGITIATNQLSLTNGAFLSAATNGQGNAGQIAIQATDTVTLDGNSYISTGVDSNGVGNSQGITIATNQLSLTNNAFLSAATYGQGDAGQVAIQATDTVTLNDGRISTSAFSNAVGNAQGINITTDRLSLANNSLLDAVSAGNNEAGEITVDANRIEIDRSRITTTTVGGAGNITLRSPELVLRNNSIIRTDAFGEELTGGNITINSDVIAALNNSDINANALQGQGGNVTINAAGIFGTSVRRENTAESDITATGKDQVEDGEITLNAEIDPTSGLVSLPESPVDAASLLGQDFCSRQRNSQFVVTGRGGIPATPADVASPTTVWQDLSLMEIAEIPTTGDNPEAEVPERLVLIEAQGWYRNEAGQVILTANPTTAMPHPPGMIPIDCETLDKVRS